VQIKLDYPQQDAGDAYSRATLGLPDEARVLMSAGRHPKFQSREFWQAIADLLAKHPHAYYVASGVREDEIPFLSSILSPELMARVLCLGWRNDFLKILPVADVVIDTYPNGGGLVIAQSMALGIPLVAHRNDYMRLFDQTQWSPVEDYITDPEIVIPRGDFDRFKSVVSRLIEDEKYRREVGDRCRAEHLRHADPSRAIRGCEEVYARVLKLFSPAVVSG
jgi:glycosyltransferase involved in cell wall biosynthesis